MSTTYTTNYHLGKQTDTSDNFDMSVITDNMDIIDTQMKSNETNISLIENKVDGKQFVFTSNAFIADNVDVGATVATTPTANNDWVCCIAECKPNDIIAVTGRGGDGARLWAFCDADYKLISKSDANIAACLELTAPSNAAYIIINSGKHDIGYCGIKSVTYDITATLAETGITYKNIATFQNQGIINSTTMTVSANTNYYYSNPIKVPKNCVVEGHTWTDNDTVSVVVLCNSNGTKIRALVKGNYRADTSYKFTTSEDTWLIFAFNKNNSHSAKYYTDISVTDYIIIGTGTDYPTITTGFKYARENDKKVIIVPDTYDLVSEGIASTSSGLSLPKAVYAYGVTFQCDLPEENWDISPVNISGAGQGTELYGLKIECSNCRYCIHDERGYATGGYYHNIFKDLELIHKSAASATLINPQCIGGGLGNGGYIEIVNCVCDCKVSDDIAYHSYAYKSAPDAAYTPQTIPCTVVIKDSYLSHKINAADIGSYTTVMNKVYVSNCSLGTAISHGAETNIKIIDWNNIVRT